MNVSKEGNLKINNPKSMLLGHPIGAVIGLWLIQNFGAVEILEFPYFYYVFVGAVSLTATIVTMFHLNYSVSYESLLKIRFIKNRT